MVARETRSSSVETDVMMKPKRKTKKNRWHFLRHRAAINRFKVGDMVSMKRVDGEPSKHYWGIITRVSRGSCLLGKVGAWVQCSNLLMLTELTEHQANVKLAFAAERS